jgi:small subunit ribosomal protein S2
VALVDTNADPSLVQYPIPANDDAIKTIQLMADYVQAAIMEGKSQVKKVEDKTEAAVPAKAVTRIVTGAETEPEPETAEVAKPAETDKTDKA